jgi:putative nucleotidyltransferase with HDIG domain
MRAAGAWLRPCDVEESWLARWLPSGGIELFQAIPRYDQQHAVHVFRTLQEQGHTDSDLLAAALLHDIGKTALRRGSLRLWHRVLVVLVRAVDPELLRSMGAREAQGWRHPFYVQQHHATIGARLAREAGCSPRTAELIGLHEDPPDPADDPMLAALKAADSIN